MKDNISDRLLSASFVLSCIQRSHCFGPYNNLLDRKLNAYDGVPLLSWTIQKGNYCKVTENSNRVARRAGLPFSKVVMVPVYLTRILVLLLKKTVL